jgi:hypothetical protein
MIEDLTMLATLPIADEKVAALAQAEADKAAAADTMPPAKRQDEAEAGGDTEAERVSRRGQDPPEQEKAGEEDS